MRIDNLLLHGARYEALPVHAQLLPVIEGVLANGANQVVPGTHRWAEQPAPPYPEGKPIEIKAGDALVWNGSLWPPLAPIAPMRHGRN